VFRIGKPVDFLQSALKALNSKDEVVKWGTVFKCTGYGGWLLLDMLQWVMKDSSFLVLKISVSKYRSNWI
jgi:hypothetical protein